MRAWVVAMALGLSAPAVATDRYAVDPAASEVTARVAFFGVASRTARFPQVRGEVTIEAGDPASARIAVVIDARTLVAPDPVTQARLTGPRFFDVAHYPELRFTGRGLAPAGDGRMRMAGTLVVRGVARPATLAIALPPALLTGSPPAAATLAADATIDRRDYGMTAWPLIVGARVDLTIRARIVRAEAAAPH